MVQYIILIAIGLVDLDTDTAMGPIYYLYLTYYHLPDLPLYQSASSSSLQIWLPSDAVGILRVAEQRTIGMAICMISWRPFLSTLLLTRIHSAVSCY